MIKVVVLMGGESPEHEVSLASGRLVVKNLDPQKYQVLAITIPNQPFDVIKLGQKIKSFAPAVVFLALHGPFGEDGRIQSWLELLKIPYTGSKVLASAIGMHKTVFKKLMLSEGLNVPPDITNKTLPVVIKPDNQGSSVGVSIVHQKKDFKKALVLAQKYADQVIVEKYLKGIEITAGLLGNKKLQALPLVEILPKGEFFDYRAKYTKGASQEIVPARISPALSQKIQEMALKVYRSVGCRGFGRVDFILVKNTPYVLEINTIPGLTSASLLPKEAAALGISYPELLEKIINLALEK